MRMYPNFLLLVTIFAASCGTGLVSPTDSGGDSSDPGDSSTPSDAAEPPEFSIEGSAGIVDVNLEGDHVVVTARATGPDWRSYSFELRSDHAITNLELISLEPDDHASISADGRTLRASVGVQQPNDDAFAFDLEPGAALALDMDGTTHALRGVIDPPLGDQLTAANGSATVANNATVRITVLDLVAAPPQGNDWSVAGADEFDLPDGSSPDATKWNVVASPGRLKIRDKKAIFYCDWQANGQKKSTKMETGKHWGPDACDLWTFTPPCKIHVRWKPTWIDGNHISLWFFSQGFVRNHAKEFDFVESRGDEEAGDGPGRKHVIHMAVHSWYQSDSTKAHAQLPKKPFPTPDFGIDRYSDWVMEWLTGPTDQDKVVRFMIDGTTFHEVRPSDFEGKKGSNGNTHAPDGMTWREVIRDNWDERMNLHIQNLALSSGFLSDPKPDYSQFPTETPIEFIRYLVPPGDPRGKPVNVTALSGITPAGATAKINADGSVTYEPPSDFVGVGGFDYVVSSATEYAKARVTVSVTAP